MSAPVALKTNVGVGSPVLVRDVGILVPDSGGQVVLSSDNDIDSLGFSANLRTLALDNAFGAGSSTLILNDGYGDLAQTYVEAFLDSLQDRGPQNRFTATTAPTVNDDVNDGFASGSRWFNNTTQIESLCLSAAAGAAVWVEVASITGGGGGGGDGVYPANSTFMMGDLLHYPLSGNFTSNEIQYTRCYLSAGIVVDRGVVFIDSGGTAARNIRMGLYSQTDPTSITGVPVTRLAQTNISATGGDNGTFKIMSFTAAYTVPTSGFYWVAMVTDSTSLKLAFSAVFRANYLPVRRETTAALALPATAGTLTNPTSAVGQSAVLRQGA